MTQQYRVNLTLEEIQQLDDLLRYEEKIRGKFGRVRRELRAAEDVALTDINEGE
jgi:uncharacterized protein YpuA (DUF1002 family)